MAKVTKKETAKVAAPVVAPKAEVKAVVKEVAKEAPAVKAAAEKKAPAAKKAPCAKKAAPAKKAGVKTAAKKAPAKKVVVAAPKTVEIQFGEQSVAYDAIVKKVTKAIKESVKNLKIYVKVDENKIYYVADNKETQSIDLF